MPSFLPSKQKGTGFGFSNHSVWKKKHNLREETLPTKNYTAVHIAHRVRVLLGTPEVTGTYPQALRVFPALGEDVTKLVECSRADILLQKFVKSRKGPARRCRPQICHISSINS